MVTDPIPTPALRIPARVIPAARTETVINAAHPYPSDLAKGGGQTENPWEFRLRGPLDLATDSEEVGPRTVQGYLVTRRTLTMAMAKFTSHCS